MKDQLQGSSWRGFIVPRHAASRPRQLVMAGECGLCSAAPPVPGSTLLQELSHIAQFGPGCAAFTESAYAGASLVAYASRSMIRTPSSTVPLTQLWSPLDSPATAQLLDTREVSSTLSTSVPLFQLHRGSAFRVSITGLLYQDVGSDALSPRPPAAGCRITYVHASKTLLNSHHARAFRAGPW